MTFCHNYGRYEEGIAELIALLQSTVTTLPLQCRKIPFLRKNGKNVH